MNYFGSPKTENLASCLGQKNAFILQLKLSFSKLSQRWLFFSHPTLQEHSRLPKSKVLMYFNS